MIKLLENQKATTPPSCPGCTDYLIDFSRSNKINMTSLEPKGFLFFTFPVTSQVFYSTELSFAFVNIKPLLPGHVLVSPVRVVARLADLTDAEVADLFVTGEARLSCGPARLRRHGPDHPAARWL